jgi:hypothetical protein
LISSHSVENITEEVNIKSGPAYLDTVVCADTEVIVFAAR